MADVRIDDDDDDDDGASRAAEEQIIFDYSPVPEILRVIISSRNDTLNCGIVAFFNEQSCKQHFSQDRH